MQYRAALAYWGEGLTQLEIARRFRATQPAIANRLHRARLALEAAGFPAPPNPGRRNRPLLCGGWVMDQFGDDQKLCPEP